MRPVTITVAGAGNSPAIPLDIYLTPFNVSLFITVVSGAIDASVEYTGDDIFDPDVTPQWFPHDTLQNEVAAADGTIISPVTAVRLVNADTGTAQLRVVQAGAA
jgi:hypothetical protein